MSFLKKVTGAGLGKNLRRLAVASTGGLAAPLLDADDRRKGAQWGLPLAGAVAGAATGNPMLALAGASIGQQAAGGMEQSYQLKRADRKQKVQQRREISRLAQAAYQDRFASGSRSLLKTSRSPGKATVG